MANKLTLGELKFCDSGITVIRPKGEIEATEVGPITYAFNMGNDCELIGTDTAMFVFNQDLIRVICLADLKTSISLFYGEMAPSHYGVFDTEAEFLADYRRIYKADPVEHCHIGKHYFIGQLMDSKALAA